MEFRNLPTNRIPRQMRPAVERIYRKVWPVVEVNYLYGTNDKPHEYDKQLGIDLFIRLRSNCRLSVQEKCRDHEAFKYHDFTQEYMNGDGTPGEWFNLVAERYFYGWANKDQTDFEDWIILDIPKYKALVERAGGLDKMGKWHKNNKHGKAEFYSIHLDRLEKAICASPQKLLKSKTDTTIDDPAQKAWRKKCEAAFLKMATTSYSGEAL